MPSQHGRAFLVEKDYAACLDFSKKRNVFAAAEDSDRNAGVGSSFPNPVLSAAVDGVKIVVHRNQAGGLAAFCELGGFPAIRVSDNICCSKIVIPAVYRKQHNVRVQFGKAFS